MPSIPDIYDLSGQVAVVTGGARGIGLSIAGALVAQGARICIVDANPDVEHIAAALSPKSFGLVVDVRDVSAIQGSVAEIIATTGKIDILVNNVGIGDIAPALELTEKIWDMTLDIMDL